MWITRDDHEDCDYVEMWDGQKPKKNSDGVFESDCYSMACMVTSYFENIFGYTPQKGSIQEVEITIKNVEK